MTDQDKITDAHIRRLENLIGLVEDEWGEYDDNLCEELLEHLKNYKAIQETMTDEQKQKQRQRIGTRIAELRKRAVWQDGNGWQRKGMTQAELGARCGLQATHIARIEKGRYSVGFDTLEAIAEGLGCRVEIVSGAAGETDLPTI